MLGYCKTPYCFSLVAQHGTYCAKCAPSIYTVSTKGARVSEELKVTRERVQAAAQECSDAAHILKKLFPEAFEPQCEEFSQESGKIRLGNGKGQVIIEVKNGGPYDKRGLYLSGAYDWSLVADASSVGGSKILIARKKVY